MTIKIFDLEQNQSLLVELENKDANKICGGASANDSLTPNTNAAIAGMEQLKNDGLVLQLADLELQTQITPVKKLSQAAKDALG